MNSQDVPFLMKELLLIRHAKSDWDHPGLSDHDRPLNSRGLNDAPRMAAALEQRGVKPDAIISSTAVRAASTATILAEAMKFPRESIIFLPELYLAPPRTILRVIQQLDEAASTVLIFGHNPGMHETVDLLSGDSGADAFPTLAVARFEFPVEYWGQIEPGSGLLVELLIPRNLEGG